MALRQLLLGTAVLAFAVSAAACAAPDDEAGDDEEEADYSALTARPREYAIDEDPSVLVEHPETLRRLEARGYDLGRLLNGASMTDNRAFAASPEGKVLAAAVTADVAEAKAKDRTVGVGMAYNHRAFDAKWLASSEARFELIGVTNRVDRRHVTPGACGEIHLVYRLAYANAQASSRLPMTVMLVYPQAKIGDDCTKTASRWLGLAKGTPDANANALARGPLAGLGIAPRVEMNFQLVRWPSTTRTDMGGHTEYSLRVFERGNSASLQTVRLENTPRTDLSAADKQALATWVNANIADIDRGTALVPQRFLADKVLSVSPKGLARGQNRPFAQLFGVKGDSLAPSLSGTALVKSKTALVRRLDTMSCTGCHQARGLAGFHLLGTDRTETSDVNALVDGVSPHLRELVDFRKRDLQKVAAKQMLIAPIPFAEHARNTGAYGTACGLGDAGFAAWTCDAGHTCSDLNGEQVGLCVSKGARQTGEACEESDVSFTSDPHQDKVSGMKVLSCSLPAGRAGRCVRSGGDPGGFPSGMCSGSCAKAGVVEGQAMCGVAVPGGFNACIGAGRPFEQCIAGGPRGYRMACDANTPCGPDYVCSAVPNAPAGVGACMPPYFIFQARVDGHLVGR